MASGRVPITNNIFFNYYPLSIYATDFRPQAM